MKSQNYITFIKSIRSSAIFPLLFVITMWVVFLIEESGTYYFETYGIYPRDFIGLRGVVLSPFIHGDWEHLTNNSYPMLFLGTAIFFFYRKVAWQVILYSMLITGIWVWVGARTAFHFGASGMIYAFAGFLFFSGVFNRNLRMMGLSLLVVFLYGSMVWGVLPIQPGVSWESHLFGGIAGLAMAWIFRKEGPKKKKIDLEGGLDELEAIYGQEYWKQPESTALNMRPINFRYVYKESKPKEEDAN